MFACEVYIYIYIGRAPVWKGQTHKTVVWAARQLQQYRVYCDPLLAIELISRPTTHLN